jgi:hypothetical protein
MSLRRLVTVALIAMAAFAVWAWTRTNQPPAPMSAGAPTTTASPQVVVESGGDPGIEWKVPPRWSKVESNPMRLATYGVPAAQGAPDEARCAVYYFGPGQGGDPETNIERWIREFEPPVEPVRASRTVDGLEVSTVRLRGKYLAHVGMEESRTARANHELYAAIVEGPSGALFFKLTGPQRTLDAAAAEFEGMLGSLRKKPS